MHRHADLVGYFFCDQIDCLLSGSRVRFAAAQRVPLIERLMQSGAKVVALDLILTGRAMDATGIRWSILSAFRDDYRQSIASGRLKAGASNSLHGGKRRTGGYGHGQAVDVTSEDGHSDDAVWRWFDRYGAKYGLRRPMPGADPTDGLFDVAEREVVRRREDHRLHRRIVRPGREE
jgi:hypothetical protein